MEKKMKAYLSGFMNPNNMERSQIWRRHAKGALHLINVESIIPRSIRSLSGDFDMFEGTPQSVVLSDLNDIDNADIMISNLLYLVDDVNNKRISLATTMELFYAAYVKRIPVVTIATANCALHPWIKYFSTVIVESVEEAVNYIKLNWCDSGGYYRMKD